MIVLYEDRRGAGGLAKPLLIEAFKKEPALVLMDARLKYQDVGELRFLDFHRPDNRERCWPTGFPSDQGSPSMLVRMPNEPDRLPPLIVLSSHRSGSSAFMGLLAEAGLHLGEVIPPAADNPRGFFENRRLVDINKRILAECDRDWTCPPAHFDHREVDLSEIGWVGDELTWLGSPWGLKDPRLLFTLPAWAAALGPCMLVGVHRNSEAVARSIVARGDLSLDEARNIAYAYAERLAEAHKRLGFPIVSFDSDPNDFIEKARKVAGIVGLDPSRLSDGSSFDSRLVNQRSSQEQLHAADTYLEAAARKDFDTIPTHTAATIVRSWQDLPSEHARGLPLHLGPRFLAKRDDLIRASVERLPDISAMAIVEPERREFEAGGMSHESMTPSEFWATLDDGGQRWSHVVAPVLFDVVPPDELRFTLDKIQASLETRAVVAIGGWFLDGEDLPDSHIFSPAGVMASRRREPYLHHVDEIAAAILGRGLYLADIRQMPGGRSHVLLTSDRSIPRTLLGTSQLRDRYRDLKAMAASLESELALRAGEAKAESHRLRAELSKERDERRDVKAELAGLRKQLKRREVEYRRLRGRRSVRVALGVSSFVRPLVRVMGSAKRKLGRPPRPKRSGDEAKVRRGASRPNAKDQSRLVRSVLRERPGSSATEGPLVSIIVLTRDGAHHLERLLPALDRATTYRSFEVIVVDNASSDNSSEVLSVDRGFPIHVITNESNTSFSTGNNQAATQASGDLLLFLNNDVEPINPGWLGSLVEAMSDEAVVGVGAELVYPIRGMPDKDLTVQHIGIGFGFRDGAVHPVNIGATDPLDANFEGTRQVPAATAAVLLVDAAAFQAVGGFDEGYVYGTEDVDLCLKLRGQGDIVVTGQAVLFHHESATQREASIEITRLNRARNYQRFAERWAPTLTRSVLIDRLSGQQALEVPHERTVAITLTHDDETRGWGDYYTAHGLGKAFKAAGWNVIYAERYEDRWYEIDADVDLVISLLDSYDVRKAPDGAFTMAWVRNWVDRWLDQPWFDSFDVVVTSSQKASDLISNGSRFVPPVIPMATDSEQFTPGPAHPTFRADYVFTGNNWGHGRSVIDLLDIHPGEEFLIFGKGWDKDPRVGRYWRGHIDHEMLPVVYRSTKVVLDDTAAPTLPYGLVNGRVFDALAAGALVLTDNIEGSQELFDGGLPTYSGAEQLRSQIDRYLSNDDERARLVEDLQSRVLAHHTYAQRPSDLLAEAFEQVGRPQAAIKIAVPDEDVQDSWGDTHFANGLASALTSLGMPTEVHILPNWDTRSSQAVDVVIHLRGLSNYTPKPAHLNVLWIISHPEAVTVQECEKYDIVLVASRQHAEWLDSQTDVGVAFMPQATDHRRFYPRDVDPAVKTDVLFLGNSRGQNRVAVDWAIRQGLPLKVYGSMWAGRIPSRYLADEYFPNERLASLYASAKVVLNDHWPDMRERGFISNRIFDALASGAVVVSDRVTGLEEVFGDLVPTYSSPEELEDVVRKLMADDQLRRRLADEGAKLVAKQHTFRHRAEQLVQLLKPELNMRQGDLQGNHLEIQSGSAGEGKG